jgi:hypothetical protein
MLAMPTCGVLLLFTGPLDKDAGNLCFSLRPSELDGGAPEGLESVKVRGVLGEGGGLCRGCCGEGKGW